MSTPPTITTHALPPARMGNRRTLTTIRYGRVSGGQKAYIQSGLHADEPPGLLVMHHLMQRLEQLPSPLAQRDRTPAEGTDDRPWHPLD